MEPPAKASRDPAAGRPSLVKALNFEYFDSIAAIITGAVANVVASAPRTRLRSSSKPNP
jgi:hypothetical protein